MPFCHKAERMVTYGGRKLEEMMTRSTGSGSAVRYVRSALALVAVLACAEALEFRALSPALGLEVVGLERRAIGSKLDSSEFW